MTRARFRTLLLADEYALNARVINDHVVALERYSTLNIEVLRFRGRLPEPLDLSNFDCILIHHDLVLALDNYLSPETRRTLRSFPGITGVFIQDEYRFINDTMAALKAIRSDIIFSVVQPDLLRTIYPRSELPDVSLVSLLTGYVPTELVAKNVRPLADRPIDLGYRARKTPAYLGQAAREKWLIGEKVKRDVSVDQLVTDISSNEKDRLYGDAWDSWLSSCKAVLGTESQISVCDFTGEIQRNVERHLEGDKNASFGDLRAAYFADIDGKNVISVVSPRVFEAAALRTLQILYEGSYSGVMQPGRHYLPLKRDHSNLPDIIKILKNVPEAQRIVDQAYEEVACNPLNEYREMVRMVDQAIVGHSKFASATSSQSTACHAVLDIAEQETNATPRPSRAPSFRTLLTRVIRQTALLIAQAVTEDTRQRILPRAKRLYRRFGDFTLLASHLKLLVMDAFRIQTTSHQTIVRFCDEAGVSKLTPMQKMSVAQLVQFSVDRGPDNFTFSYDPELRELQVRETDFTTTDEFGRTDQTELLRTLRKRGAKRTGIVLGAQSAMLWGAALLPVVGFFLARAIRTAPATTIACLRGSPEEPAAPLGLPSQLDG